MSCFAVVWTMQVHDKNFPLFSLKLQIVYTLEVASQATWKNREVIAETQSCISSFLLSHTIYQWMK